MVLGEAICNREVMSGLLKHGRDLELVFAIKDIGVVIEWKGS
jgi:hypothetical protein